MIEYLILAAIILGGLLIRMPPPLALLMGAGFGTVTIVGVSLGGGSSHQTMALLANAVDSVLSSYAAAALVLLVFIGVVFERCGTVMAIPFGSKDTALHLDRSTGFSGGALGLPLPAMAPVFLLSILLESSITQGLTSILPPLIGLSLIYLAIFLPTALAGSRRERHPALPADTPSLVLSCTVPPVFLILLILPTASGALTPTEAIGAAIILATVILILHIALSATARASLGDSIIRGVGAAAMIIILMIAMSMLAQVFALTGTPTAIVAIVQQILPSAYLVAISALVIGLGIGTLAGPLTGVSLATLIAYPAANTVGFDLLNFMMLMAVTAEAVRVGPQLHGKGFLKRVSDDGKVSLGSWPYYGATVVVAALTPLIPPIF